jgi:hypothetical protein
MKADDYDYVTLVKNKTRSRLTEKMMVCKDVRKSRQEQT